MGKFVIECPKCGNYSKASNFIFAKKKIDCSCGYTIDVKTERLSTRICSTCGNSVVFDQAKGAKAKCPVCNNLINTYADMANQEEISCGQCGIRLMVSKAAATYTCPVCDHVNDVAERLVSEKVRKDGIISIIKYEGDAETLVWKHPVEDINYGSQLIVHESQEAIFFRDGQALDLFGPGRYTLETQQLPFLTKMYDLSTNTEGTFHSEVYYINLSSVMGVKWGTDTKVRLFDPASGLHLEIGACGEFNIRVVNSRKLLVKLVGTTSGLNQSQLVGTDGKGYFRAMVMTQVKSYLAQTIKENEISILEIDERLMELSLALKERINNFFIEYGLEIIDFFVTRVITPDDDPNFKKMRDQYAAQYLLVREEQIKQKEAEAAAGRKMVEARTEAQLQMIGAQGEAESLKIKAQAEAEAYRMQAEVEAMEMKMKGYTYQQETARQVGLEAMQNGLTGGSTMGTGTIGDLAGLGVGLGAMGSVLNLTKDAMNPALSTVGHMGQGVAATMNPEIVDSWECSCGNKVMAGMFCNICGNKKPVQVVPETWDCECGNRNIFGNFCNMCGKKRG